MKKGLPKRQRKIMLQIKQKRRRHTSVYVKLFSVQSCGIRYAGGW